MSNNYLLFNPINIRHDGNKHWKKLQIDKKARQRSIRRDIPRSEPEEQHGSSHKD